MDEGQATAGIVIEPKRQKCPSILVASVRAIPTRHFNIKRLKSQPMENDSEPRRTSSEKSWQQKVEHIERRGASLASLDSTLEFDGLARSSVARPGPTEDSSADEGI